MPLVTQLFLAHVAGSWLAFTQRDVAVASLAVALLVLAARRRSIRELLAALALVHAALAAARTRQADLACRDRIVLTGSVDVRLLEPLRRSRSAAASTSDACRLKVRVASSYEAPAGTLVRVRGAFRRAGDGLAVRRASVLVLEGAGALDRSRARIGAQIDRAFERDGPLVRALVLAEQFDLDPELRARWADAGIIHMVSVSGLHVSIIAGALIALLSATGLSRARAECGAILLLVAYIAWIGAPPPAVRSAGMTILVVLSRWMQRPTSPWAVWASGSALSLVEPRVVLDLGWQLSVAGMAGLMATSRWTERVRRFVPWQRTILEGIIATGVATVATAPIIAWTFGRISVAALITNLVAAPLFNIAQPLLFASVSLAWLPDLVSGFLVDSARGALGLIGLVASLGSKLPGSVVSVAPDAFTASCLIVLAVSTVAVGVSTVPRRWASAGLAALVAASWSPLVPRGNGRLELHVIDVGQGDALALRSPSGRWLLVDAGPGWMGGDAGSRIVGPYLRRYGGDVVHQVVSHPHLDHYGGVRGLLPAMDIDTLWESGAPAGEDFLRLEREALRTGTVWRRLVSGDSLMLDGVILRVLAPAPAWRDAQSDPNEASVVLRVEYGNQRWLLTGDAGAGTEQWLLQHRANLLRSDVLKAGHHGSHSSTTPAFLAAVRPKLAIASVGRDNDYGHPHDDVLQRLDEAGVRVLRTDDEGSIILSTDGRSLVARTERLTWHCCDESPRP